MSRLKELPTKNIGSDQLQTLRKQKANIIFLSICKCSFKIQKIIVSNSLCGILKKILFFLKLFLKHSLFMIKMLFYMIISMSSFHKTQNVKYFIKKLKKKSI